jgi:hypothetical protein
VQNVGCIRPSYKKNPLPSAAEEEQDLVHFFGPLSLANDRPQLDKLLGQTDIDLLHSRAMQHNPASLRLGDTEEPLQPEAFYGKGLTTRPPSPFFFVNGCEAGLGRTGVLPTRGNMLETLLACKLVGAVALLIIVDCEAARDAPRALYAASIAGRSVGEAVQAIHALAKTQPNKAGTFLSYVAYAPPHLHLRFRLRS